MIVEYVVSLCLLTMLILAWIAIFFILCTWKGME